MIMSKLLLKYYNYRFNSLRMLRDNILNEYDTPIGIYNNIINGNEHLVELRYLKVRELVHYYAGKILDTQNDMRKLR